MMPRPLVVLLAMAVFTLASAACAHAADAAEKLVAAPKPQELVSDGEPILTKAGWKIYTKWPFDAKEAKRRQEETAKALGIPVEKAVMLPQKIAMKFMLVPAGEFIMGSPETELKRNDDETQHRVRITTPYYLGKYEFRQGAWITGRMQGGKFAKNRSYQLDWKKPVEQASWKDAAITLLHLNRRGLGLFTLPTEAEWEFACRAGTTTPFSFGETISHDQANYDSNSVYGKGKRGKPRMKTVRGGALPANAFGLHEMHGNVWEWCYDYYDKDFYTTGPVINPIGPKTGTHHVARGGSFAIFPVDNVRSACRRAYPTLRRGRCVGFRIVLRTLKPKPKPKAEAKPKPKPEK